MIVKTTNDGIYVTDISDFSLDQTLDCGQCFRWRKSEDGLWCGVVKNVYREIRQEENGITILKADMEEFNDIWLDYFDFNRDYNQLKQSFSQCEMLKNACEFASGIRVLHQQAWETYISFIISQNNNIVRIKGIIEKLCDLYGKKIEKSPLKMFPSPYEINKIDEEELRKIGLGYRAPYVKSAARFVVENKINFDLLKNMKSDKGREILLSVYGVGPKVADCILLYGIGKMERCPMDVWMKRVLKALGGKMPDCTKGNEGIAQQFLFHYSRHFPEKFNQ